MNIWLAPAKINLFLHVLGRRADGYHEIQTVFQLIDWYDELGFEATDDGSILREPHHVPGIAQRDDLTCRAAKLLQEACSVRQGARIRLNKRIPIGAGLGGGSSDAAATLHALNQIWGTGLSDSELAAIGVAAGADVPVFVYGHSAWGEGIGDSLKRITLPRQCYVIAVPRVSVSTRTVFADVRLPTGSEPETPESWDMHRTRNDLEPAACRVYREVDALLMLARRFGAARMSGSGGAVFVPADSASQASSIAAQLGGSANVRICEGIDVHPMRRRKGPESYSSS